LYTSYPFETLDKRPARPYLEIISEGLDICKGVHSISQRCILMMLFPHNL